LSANPYDAALKAAQKELADCENAADKLDCQKAKLRQTIASLQSQLGVAVERSSSLTEAILTALKANPGYSRAVEVARQLQHLGYTAAYTSVATILARLAKNGRITHAVGPDESTGYAWKTDTTKQEQQEAKKALAGKAPKNS
jgi:predicted transcriptional regulator